MKTRLFLFMLTYGFFASLILSMTAGSVLWSSFGVLALVILAAVGADYYGRKM